MQHARNVRSRALFTTSLRCYGSGGERKTRLAMRLETFTILTTKPNAVCARIHNRMPVMLARDDWSNWLGTLEERNAVLTHASLPPERMECRPVGKAVGKCTKRGADIDREA